MDYNYLSMYPEWEKQTFVQLTWPHEGTDWKPILAEAEDNFVRIAREIVKHEGLLIVAPDIEHVKQLFAKEQIVGDIRFAEIDTNDTWARDHGPISVRHNSETELLDYCFNGWGMKFAADKDNLITSRLKELGFYKEKVLNKRDFVLEGGSIETDGYDTLLTTSRCLLSPNRNAKYTKEDIEHRLTEDLGFRRFLWFNHGALTGDDTDSHIDTLARLVCNHGRSADDEVEAAEEKFKESPDDPFVFFDNLPLLLSGYNHTIIYQGCRDTADENYEELAAMRRELEAFRTPEGEPYRLVELPMPAPQYYEGQRLPASYANYLVINGAVLVPTYASPETDAEAMRLIGECFPGREVVGIDCRTLIKQHGSLHCVTMQYY